MPRVSKKKDFGTIEQFVSSAKKVKEEPSENEENTIVETHSPKDDIANIEEIKKEVKEEREHLCSKMKRQRTNDADSGTSEDEKKPTPKKTTAKKGRATKKPKIEDGEEKPKKTRGKKNAEGESAEQKQLRETIGKEVLDTVGSSGKMLGYHVSMAGGVEQAVYNAMSTGCRAFALFIRNQRTWNHKPMEEERVVKWNAAVKEFNYDLSQIVPHGSYLLNPGSPDLEKLGKSREAMLDECKRCEKLGIKLYNFHPGSTTGDCTVEECIKTIAETINYVIKKTSSIILVIETMAGQGHTVGGKFHEIRSIIDQVDDKSRVGVCIDTCHIFAAGYDFRTQSTYNKMMKEFEDVIGFKYLKAFHLNDSKGDLGCKLDRHENIGKGKIGKKGFELLMNDSRLDGIPFILETPEGLYPEEMMLLYGLDDRNKK